MSGTYLPGDTRQRIQDLIKDSSITQAELAGIIGLSESALNRYLKGQTEMLGDGYIIKIAKHFKVSTDFLLGETDIPDRKNYDIEELGLSVKTAKLLYTGRLDSRVLNLLPENRHLAPGYFSHFLPSHRSCSITSALSPSIQIDCFSICTGQ